MKFRTLLLVACMIVVPATAMFSHQVPAATRAAIRQAFMELAAGRWRKPPSAAGSPSGQPSGPAAGEPQRPSAGPEQRLAALGAIGLECRPLPGDPSTLAASCRVPIDGSGQLLRMFQATGPDAETAVATLADVVAAWGRRQGSGGGNPDGLR